jgi:hypothetical protein
MMDGIAATGGEFSIYIPVASYFYVVVPLSSIAEPAEGYHHASTGWRVNSPGFTLLSLGAANGTCLLNGFVSG